MLTIDPPYFKTVGLSLQRGRDLTDEDGMTGRESAIINQRFATRCISRTRIQSDAASRSRSICRAARRRLAASPFR